MDASENSLPRAPDLHPATARHATIQRVTGETDITLSLTLDGTGRSRIETGIGFLDHMLTALAGHALFDLEIKAIGDLHTDFHHTTEDIGIVLGQALVQAIGNKAGIRRYGHAVVPMDEALVEAAIDMSGRSFLVWNVTFPRDKIGEMDTELFEEFFRGFAGNAQLALHVTQKAGTNNHHIAEGCFKAVARALRAAVEADPRTAGVVPSTKGVL
ncbi:imidazoleglycerol-phosphate dehydratase HisB [Lichenicola cladoniae]|uniref:Imidazoleglycerol-phosphate dehydratase n=1 Tax=Lichenicola cladoniae TaxID=1484109 RepID=A0A6M8HTB1_9PROT|nr:imidazoleglycerol-phosphate dehydratase HisB [Lichenicola cladoniae]NPD65409.1 imidazoleglycerol-phosphate dehydratase HisB [Acetobacteraceae bacterium]QKE91516.1 imidazoleglycerol-phosphate dehydratase HisB [Lichenicola cladoniae]